jgi:hypothetical protein
MIRGERPGERDLLARNDAAGNDKDGLLWRHLGVLMAVLAASVKQTILFMPH